MSTHDYFKETIGPRNDSVVAEVSPEDVANIAKGADDIDDGFNLFGFKTKQLHSLNVNVSTDNPSQSMAKKTALKTQANDFPEGDLLADISLSDDDFYDIEKKSPSLLKNQYKGLLTTPKKSVKDKETKSKIIANLFGLDNEDDATTDTKRKQQSAADWLGIKDSPVKTISDVEVEKEEENHLKKTSLTIPFRIENIVESGKPEESMKELKTDINTGSIRNVNEIELDNVNDQKANIGILKSESIKKNPKTPGADIFDSIGDKSGDNVESSKERKSAIFEELFGESGLKQKKTNDVNVTNKIQDTSEPKALAAVEGGSASLGLYTPSLGAGRRPGLGRRRETTLPLGSNTTKNSILFEENWLPSSQQGSQKDTMQLPKFKKNNLAINENDVLPAWLGSAVVIPETKSQVKLTSPITDVQVADSVKDVLSKNDEQDQQTLLSLQRTETQLVAALELQASQSSLSAVCMRQQSILEHQEKHLADLINCQTQKQASLEKQLTIQQKKIQHLLEVLTATISMPTVTSEPQMFLEEETSKKEQHSQIIKNLEMEIQKTSLENEDLRNEIKRLEKHNKMEIEYLQEKHRRDIKFWEDQLAKEKEFFTLLSDDFKERVARLKENEIELIAQHNQRIERLKEEREDDMKQLIQFHKMTFEQVVAFSKLLAPTTRQEQAKPSDVRKPLGTNEISEKEEELLKKEKIIYALQEKLKTEREKFEKHFEEKEGELEEEKIKNEKAARELKQEQNLLRLEQQQLYQEKKHLEEHYHMQRKMLEDIQERTMSGQTQLISEKLALAEEKARLDALAKLQGVSGTASFDVLQAKAEVHGALEAARSAELQAVEERRQLKEKEHALDSHQLKLQEMEENLTAKAEHLNRLMQVSQSNQEDGHKALEEAKLFEKRAEEKMKEVERRKMELKEKEQKLIRLKLEIAQEEIRISRKREQLEHVLPPLSTDEAGVLQPIKDVIDPKLLIMKLRAEREFEAISKPDGPIGNLISLS